MGCIMGARKTVNISAILLRDVPSLLEIYDISQSDLPHSHCTTFISQLQQLISSLKRLNLAFANSIIIGIYRNI